MAAPRYGSISAIGNRVTVVTCPMSAGSALAPRRGEVAAMLGRGRRPSCDVTSLSTRMSCRVEVTSAGREPPRGGYGSPDESTVNQMSGRNGPGFTPKQGLHRRLSARESAPARRMGVATPLRRDAAIRPSNDPPIHVDPTTSGGYSRLIDDNRVNAAVSGEPHSRGVANTGLV